MVRSQIGNLTFGPSFGHNLCCKCPNGSCEPILNIYVPRAFQKYKEIFNPMSFDPWNCPLKIWKSIGTPTPKVRVHLWVWGFIPISMKCDSRDLLLAHTFANLCLSREPKAKVMTSRMSMWFWMNKVIRIGTNQRTLLVWILNSCCLDHDDVT
jgi:hypothetical protein